MAEEKPKTDNQQPKAKVSKLIEEISALSVLELAELVKALEEKFGVIAQIPVAAPAGGAAPLAGAGAPVSEEQVSVQATFNVVLTATGANKISVIKAVREVNQTLGLKEAKDLVESPPKEILIGVNKETAEAAKKRLEEAGATVELK